MNPVLTALTRPRMASGVSVCTRVLRVTTLTMSDAPTQISAAKDSGVQRDTPKINVATPKIATAITMRGPICRGRAPRRGARHQAQPDRADHQNVAGENRQQRGSAAKQHAEQFERDRAQPRLVVADEIDAAAEGFPGQRRRGALDMPLVDAKH